MLRARTHLMVACAVALLSTIVSAQMDPIIGLSVTEPPSNVSYTQGMITTSEIENLDNQADDHASRLLQMPAGRRALDLRKLPYQILKNPNDHIRNPDGSINTSLRDGEGAPSLWLDEAATEMADILDSYFEELQNAGASLDYIILDMETGVGYSNAELDALQLDPRWSNPPQGSFDPAAALQATGKTLAQVKSGDPAAVLAWNDVKNQAIAHALNRAIFDTADNYFPGIRGANYNYPGIEPSEQIVNRYNSQFYKTPIIGTHGSQSHYGSLFAIQGNPLDGQHPYGGSAFARFRYEQQLARAARRSNLAPYMPWIAWETYASNFSENQKYFHENLRHLALLSDGIVLIWNSKSSPGRASDLTDQHTDDTLADVNTQLYNATQRTLVDDSALAWDSRFVATGVRISPNSVLWRLTVLRLVHGQTAAPIDVDVYEDDLLTATITIPQGEVGVWYTSSSTDVSFEVPEPEAANLLTNAITQWTAVAAAVNTGHTYNGNDAVLVTADSTSTDTRYQHGPTTVYPDHTYTFSVYLKRAGVGTQWVGISVYDADTQTLIKKLGVQLADNEWRRYVLSFTTGPQTDAINVQLGGDGMWRGTDGGVDHNEAAYAALPMLNEGSIAGDPEAPLGGQLSPPNSPSVVILEPLEEAELRDGDAWSLAALPSRGTFPVAGVAFAYSSDGADTFTPIGAGTLDPDGVYRYAGGVVPPDVTHVRAVVSDNQTTALTGEDVTQVTAQARQFILAEGFTLDSFNTNHFVDATADHSDASGFHEAQFNLGGDQNQFMKAPSSPTIETEGKDFVLAGWFKAETSQFGYLVDKQGTTTREFRLYINPTDYDKVVFQVYEGDGAGSIGSVSLPITINQWHFVEASYDDATCELRLRLDNGTPAQSIGSGDRQQGQAEAPLILGGRGNGTYDNFRGSMASWAMWTGRDSLDSSEHAALYNAGTPLHYEQWPTSLLNGLAAAWIFAVEITPPSPYQPVSGFGADSWSNNDLTNAGAVSTTADGFPAAAFNIGGDQDQSMNVASNASLETEGYSFVLAGWVNVEADHFGEIFNKRGTTTREYRLYFTSSSGRKIHFVVYDGSTTNNIIGHAEAAVSLNQWSFVEAGYDEQTRQLRLRIDGGTPVLVAGTSTARTDQQAISPVTLGGRAGTYDNFRGRLAGWAFFRNLSMLTEDEHTALYNGGIPLPFEDWPVSLEPVLISAWLFIP